VYGKWGWWQQLVVAFAGSFLFFTQHGARVTADAS
jgi:hypothetical protein